MLTKPMKINLACVIGLIAFLSASILASGPMRRMLSRRPDRPVISLSASHIRLGRLRPGEKAEAEVVIENQGGRILRLDDPKATCGCQTPLLTKGLLKPGERTTLRLQQIAGQEIGQFRHMVFLRSNDPVTPQINLYLDGTVSKGVLVRPEPLIFEDMAPGESRTRSITISSDEAKPFLLKFVNGFGPIKVAGTLNVASEVHKIEVTAQAPETLGEFEGQVIANLDIPESVPLTIKVRGLVRGPFQTSPRSIDLGVQPGHNEVTRRLVVRASQGLGFHIVSVGGLSRAWRLSHSLEEDEYADGRHSLLLHFVFPSDSGPSREAVRIELSPEKGPSKVIEVPLTVMIAPSVPSKPDANRGS